MSLNGPQLRQGGHTPKMKSVLITGANAGLGKESARQLALLDSIERVYLGCRKIEKAEAAKAELEHATGQSVFEVLQIDVMDMDSVRAAVRALPAPIDGLLMNAGGMGGPTPRARTMAAPKLSGFFMRPISEGLADAQVELETT